MDLADFLAEGRTGLKVAVLLSFVMFVVLASEVQSRRPKRSHARPVEWKSFDEDGFHADVPKVLELPWKNEQSLPGFSGYTYADGGKARVYALLRSKPARPWTDADARSFLLGPSMDGWKEKIWERQQNGRKVFELDSTKGEEHSRFTILLDGPRVIIASVTFGGERDAEIDRFLDSLRFDGV